MQRQSQQAKKLASSLVKLKGTRLKLGIMCTIGPTNFVGLLGNLQTQYPGIELEIFDAGAPDLQERLLEGAIEAAIYCWPDRIEERLHYLALFREHAHAMDREPPLPVHKSDMPNGTRQART